tara:strand:- start:1957 stop:2220 length:264 start_codon:yes stop_codon:yes gene_type:complete
MSQQAIISATFVSLLVSFCCVIWSLYVLHKVRRISKVETHFRAVVSVSSIGDFMTDIAIIRRVIRKYEIGLCDAPLLSKSMKLQKAL